VIPAGALRYLPHHPAGTISTIRNGVLFDDAERGTVVEVKRSVSALMCRTSG